MSKQVRSRQFDLPAMLVMLAGQAQSLRAQEAVAPAAPINAAATAPGAQPPATPAPAPAVPAAAATATAAAAVTPPVVKSQTISFAFKDTPWDQVLDFLARQTGLPLDEVSLKRVSHTEYHRAGLDAKARRASVAQAFAVMRPRLLEKEIILLLDDVFTTGATVGACAATLRAAGAAEVRVLTLARVASGG